jgi:hypothetical protein
VTGIFPVQDTLGIISLGQETEVLTGVYVQQAQVATKYIMTTAVLLPAIRIAQNVILAETQSPAQTIIGQRPTVLRSVQPLLVLSS